MFGINEWSEKKKKRVCILAYIGYVIVMYILFISGRSNISLKRSVKPFPVFAAAKNEGTVSLYEEKSSLLLEFIMATYPFGFIIMLCC